MRFQHNSKTKIFFQESFYTLTASLLIFAILEIIWPRVILAYINISKLLIIWLIIVIILLKLPESENK